MIPSRALQVHTHWAQVPVLHQAESPVLPSAWPWGGAIGSVIGAAIGAVAGGLSGKGLAEAVNPTAEELYWRETYLREPYYAPGKPYEYYAPGFRAGWEGRVRYDGRTFDEAELDLAAEYLRTKSEIDPSWAEVSPAARAAWNRVDGTWTSIV